MVPSNEASRRPAASALQNLLQKHPISPTSPHPPHLHHLALQIAHNLRYQHGWTTVRLHYACPDPDPASGEEGEDAALPLPRPMVSGLPPQSLYVHPDEQLELLQRHKSAGKTGMPPTTPLREWVLPSHLREKWSLRRFGEVFDGIGRVPDGGRALFADEREEEEGRTDGRGGVVAAVDGWRAALPKRLLLATLDDDATVVYYIVHDGVVKPRQN